MNRSMPSCVIIPEFAYRNVREAVEGLCRSFEFLEQLQIGHHRAQLTFGEGSVIVRAQREGQGPESSEDAGSHPSPVGKSSHSVIVRMADVGPGFA
jgi:hypothetical protein